MLLNFASMQIGVDNHYRVQLISSLFEAIFTPVLPPSGFSSSCPLLMRTQQAIQHGKNGLSWGSIGALCYLWYRNLAVRAGPSAEEIVVDRVTEVLVGVVSAVNGDSSVAEGQAEQQADKDGSIQHQENCFKSKSLARVYSSFFLKNKFSMYIKEFKYLLTWSFCMQVYMDYHSQVQPIIAFSVPIFFWYNPGSGLQGGCFLITQI